MMLPFELPRFIDREEDVEFLKSLVLSVLKSEKIDASKRVFHLVGMASIGKTSLLRRYEYCLTHELPTSCSFNISFLDYATLPVEMFVERVFRAFELQIDTHLGVQPLDNDDITIEAVAQYASRLQGNIETLQRDKAVVFLIDEVDILKRDMVEALEDYMLALWLNFPKSIFFLTGRSIVTGWKNFDLRPTADNIRNLGAFNHEHTELQVLNENPAAKHLTDQIFEISGGSPGINKNILDQARGNPPEIVELDAIRACNREFYEAIGKAGTGLPANLAAELLPALEALCVLQDFDREYEAPVLFTAHKNLSGNWDVKRSISLFSILTNIQIGPGKLIDWDMSKNAYAIEEQTRTTLEQEIQIRDNELRHTLHCTAMKMYTGWADEYDSDIFRNKAAYHRAKLEQAGFDPADCEAKD